MKQFSYCVDQEHSISDCLSEFLKDCPKEHSAIWVTVFTGMAKSNAIWSITEKIHEMVPEALIAGVTGSGEMLSGHLCMDSTVLSFMVFERAKVKVFAFDFSRMSPEDAGTVLMGHCRRQNELVSLTLFTTLKTSNVKPLFKTLNQLPPSIAVFGGGADTHQSDGVPYVFTNGALFKRGAIVVCLEGSSLEVTIASHLGWRPVGEEMEITEMFGDNIITKLDHMPAISVYEGSVNKCGDDCPAQDNMDFPVLLERDGQLLARMARSYTNDGAMLFTADFELGEKVRAACGNTDEIIKLSEDVKESITKFEPEGIMVFNCVSRRTLWGGNTKMDSEFLGNIGVPNAGMYTHGEIGRPGKNIQVLNATMLLAGFKERKS